MIVNVNGIDLYYEKYGEGAPLIMLHGNGETHKIFKTAIKKLKDKFTVYAIDTRGHGRSSVVNELHYSDMAEDIIEFIKKLKLDKPVLYGFSDGGIVGIMVAVSQPQMLSQVIASGVNINPGGFKTVWLKLCKVIYGFTRSPMHRIIIEEPNISYHQLHNIIIPIHLTMGSNDIITRDHIRLIAENIPQSTLTVFDKETHGSYVVNSKKIADFILKILENKETLYEKHN